MSWTCPHQIDNNFCSLRKKECKLSSEGCVLVKRFIFIEKDSKIEETTVNKKKSKNKQNLMLSDITLHFIACFVWGLCS